MTDISVLKELQDLRNTNIYEFLQFSLQDTLKSLSVAANEVTVRQLQGKAQALDDLLSLIDNAGDEIIKLKKSKNTAQMF